MTQKTLRRVIIGVMCALGTLGVITSLAFALLKEDNKTTEFVIVNTGKTDEGFGPRWAALQAQSGARMFLNRSEFSVSLPDYADFTGPINGGGWPIWKKLSDGDVVSLEHHAKGWVLFGEEFMLEHRDVLRQKIAVPLGDRTADVPLAYSGSAFLVHYRDRTFLVSASHVVSGAGLDHEFLFNDGTGMVSIPGKWEFGDNDLVAVEVTGLPVAVAAGELDVGTDDLGGGRKNLSPDVVGVEPPQTLVPLCEKYLHEGRSVGYSVGMQKVLDDFPPLLAIRFPSAVLSEGCSGAAVVDQKGHIRGMVMARMHEDGKSTDKGSLVYAVPASQIAEFLDKEFTSK